MLVITAKADLQKCVVLSTDTEIPLTVHGVNEIRNNDFSNTLRNFNVQ
jgi:hypothetical protein